MKTLAESKYLSVRKGLETEIRTGKLMAGDQLPAEQAIAEVYGVSLMTARRAVSDLVAADLLERRARKGTFVRSRTRDRLERVTLNLVTTAYEGSAQKDFLYFGTLAGQCQGWNINIIRLTAGQQDPAVRVIRNGELAIVMLDEIAPSSSLGMAMRAARGRAVSMHRRLWDVGVPSIVTNRKQEILLAIEHLHQFGHKRIAVAAQFPTDESSEGHVVQWQQDLSAVIHDLGLDPALIRVNTPMFQSPMQQAYEAVKEFLPRNPEMTALLTTGDEIAIGALAACRDLGRPAPAGMSLVNCGDSSLMKFVTPAVTCIDSHFECQFEIAVNILRAATSGADIGELRHVNLARLIERGSVSRI